MLSYPGNILNKLLSNWCFLKGSKNEVIDVAKLVQNNIQIKL